MTFLKTLRARAQEQGMTTSEYAVGTVGACTVGGAIYSIATSDWFNDFIKGVFEKGIEILPFM
ncbi:DUF4244 domain-containing protein [Mumia sp. DW29H23]|uniref:DUF4244 domain-containing protein n=1 Tax=Mumia sp. DW29H23 TaxID=3421241 RepID=UPI003D6825B2